MKVINLGERSSVINSYMAQLRDVDIQQNRTLFRRNMQRIARAIAYEVSRTLNYSDKTITTPSAQRGSHLRRPHCSGHCATCWCRIPRRFSRHIRPG